MVLSVVGALFQQGNGNLVGVNDFAIFYSGSRVFLLTGSEARGNFGAYYIYSDAPPRRRGGGSDTDTTGSYTLSGFELLNLNDETYLLTSGRYDDNASLVQVSASGSFDAGTNITGTASDYGHFSMTKTVEVDGKTFTFVVRNGVSGIESYRIMGDMSFKQKRDYNDDANSFLGDVTAMETFTIGDKTFLITSSGIDTGVHTFVVGRHGNLRARDTVSPFDGSGIALAADIDVVSAGGQLFALLASSGTDSLTVYRINNHGMLVETDHILDTIDTRFRGASVMEVVEHNERAYVFIAGSDDGLTVFELLPDGRLYLREVMEDDFDITLGHVSTIETVVLDNRIQVFAGSNVEHGLTQFEYAPENTGVIRIGDGLRDTLHGTNGDDILLSSGNGDTIYGRNGDDIIDGGNGRDEMYGGGGADTFVFAPDGRRDVIHDFQLNRDMIDLRQYERIGHVDDIDIRSRAFGAVIVIEGETIRIETANGTRLAHDDFSNDDFIF